MHSHMIWILRAHKFAHEQFHVIATYFARSITLGVIYSGDHLERHTLHPWKSPQAIAMFIIKRL